MVKYSPKGEKILGTLDDIIEGETNEGESEKFKATSLDKLCTTRWAVRASCFNKSYKRYDSLQSLWQVCLREKLESEVCGRIIRCQSQMESFWFFFGLLLSHRLYSLTDNLSKTLQKERISALNGQRLAKLTVETLEGMRTNESFDLFCESVKKKATNFDVEEPTLPRKRHRPKYSSLQYVQGHEETARNTKAFHPQSAADHFRLIFFDAIDNVVMALQDRFQQPSYQFFSNIEQFLLKSINSDPYQTEMDALMNYTDDLDISALPAEIHVLRSVCKNEKVASFDEITEKIIKLSATERNLFGNVIKLMKLVLVAAATVQHLSDLSLLHAD